MPIEVVDNRSKLKKRQSYRSQRPDREEEIEDNSGMKYGGMKKKTKKMKTGGMSKARGTGCAIRGTNFKGIF